MTKKNLQLSILLAATAALSACGSGSSGPAATAPEATAPTTPPATAESVMVTGFVTDMPIPNATVVLTVNGQEFTAPNPTGADGSFSVEIESDDPDALVQCEAFDPNGPARFSALLNSFGGLQDNAGDDGVAADVNITNVTTAQFLLAQALATDGSIDSLEELEDVSGRIDPDELLELSAAIKVVVDSVSDVVLPDEFADVQALAQAIVDGTTTFLDDIEVLNPGILADTIIEVVSDGFATVPFAAARIPGVYLSADGADVAVFYADGTGLFGEEEFFGDSLTGVVSEQIVEAVTWSVTDSGALELVFTESQDVETVVMLNEAGSVITLYSSIENGDGTAEEPETFSVVRFGFDATGFDATTVPGSYNDPEDDESETEFTVFLADGSGYDIDVATGAQDDFFSWEVNGAGELIITDDGLPDNDGFGVSDERQVVRLLEGSVGDTLNILAVEFDLDGEAAIGIEAFPVAYTAEILTGPMPDMANTALLQGKTYAWRDGFEMGLSTFGGDGVFSEIIQDFDEVDGPDFFEDVGEWSVDDSGALSITFVEPDGVVETDAVSVASGLGADRMVVLVDDADNGATTELGLDRVIAFNSSEMVGTWAFFEDGQLVGETATFDADGTGSYFNNGVLDETFTWAVDSAGKLVATLDEVTSEVAVWTDNFHKLADSDGDTLHAFVVFRLGGELANDADDPTGPPEVMLETTLIRQL